jgi:hypothetical protein
VALSITEIYFCISPYNFCGWIQPISRKGGELTERKNSEDDEDRQGGGGSPGKAESNKSSEKDICNPVPG